MAARKYSGLMTTLQDPEPSAMSGDCSSANAAPLSADECVICLTDPKEVLLIPCRCVMLSFPCYIRNSH